MLYCGRTSRASIRSIQLAEDLILDLHVVTMIIEMLICLTRLLAEMIAAIVVLFFVEDVS